MAIIEKHPYLKWAVISIVLLIIAQFSIILVPSLITIISALVLLLLTLTLFFIRLWRDNHKRGRYAAVTSIITTVLFIATLTFVLRLSQEHLLFGYKAVNNRLSPALVSGDHYLGDKLIYTIDGPQKGCIYVIRMGKKRGLPARLITLPGEQLQQSVQRVLGDNEYGFDLGGEIVVITDEQILARAIINYHTYDPDSEKIVWERMGKIIP